jgi:hypothetical protein
MRARLRVFGLAIASVAIFGAFGGTASAGQPTPPNCVGSYSNNGQVAGLVQSLVGVSAPGLSGYDTDAAVTGLLQGCGAAGG